jgi:Lrp/AsnC family leucine-responsive transcriptional regulator
MAKSNHQNQQIDDTDYKIIELMRKNARVSVKEIADTVFLSPTAISSRIDKLERDGIISGYHAHINPAALGYDIKAFINLEVEPEQKQEFYPYIESCFNVVECSCVTGDFSMLIEVVFKDTMSLDRFIGELQRFGKTKTQIAFSTSVEHRDMFYKIRE